MESEMTIIEKGELQKQRIKEAGVCPFICVAS